VAESLRLDKFLWFARIVKTRALAQALAEGGRLRIGGRIVDRAHAPVRIGDVLSFAQQGRVRVVRVDALPARRGPPAEARGAFVELDAGSGGARPAERAPRGIGLSIVPSSRASSEPR
jgi:ribosome-associated heat shock protein Hsp15